MNIHSALLLLCLGALPAGLALADDATPPPPASAPTAGMPSGRPMHRFPDPVIMANRHLARLKAALQPTDAQQPAWQAFADKVAVQARHMKAEREKMRSAPPGTTAPQRMAQVADMMHDHARDMAAVAAAAQSLYDQLTPAQRQTFDRMAERRSRMMRARRMPASAPAQ